MLYRFIFKNLSLEKQAEHIKSYGVTVGTRYNGERNVHLYMIKDFFIEVTYEMDDPENSIEKLKVFSSHKELNKYLVSS